jgi:hypothetical protein
MATSSAYQSTGPFSEKIYAKPYVLIFQRD